MQRIGAFIAKLILRKHQRALVTNFKKYQLESFAEPDDSGQTSGKVASEKSMLLGGGPPEASIQADGTVSYLAEFEGDPDLTEQQMSLLKEIAEQFSCEEAADLGILFEVTGY